MSLLDRVLDIARTKPIDADSIEDGLDMLAARLGGNVARAEIEAAVRHGVALGRLRDPVRIPEGALHCRWRLEPASCNGHP